MAFMPLRCWALLVLVALVTSKAMNDQPNRAKCFASAVLGFYGLGFPALLFVFVDMGLLP